MQGLPGSAAGLRRPVGARGTCSSKKHAHSSLTGELSAFHSDSQGSAPKHMSKTDSCHCWSEQI